MDRPGPNSGGKWCSSTTRSRTDVSLPTTFSLFTQGSRASLADVRVEGRLGCTPSEAAPQTSNLRCSEAKFCDPIEVFEDCPQGPGFPGTLAVQCRRSSCQSDSTHVVLSQLFHPTPNHSPSVPTPADVAMRGDPTLRRPRAPAGPCLGSTHCRPLWDPFDLLGVAIAVSGILLSLKQRRRMQRWAVFRIFPGHYRRRPLKGPHDDLAPGRRARLPATLPTPNRKPVGFRLLPFSARLLGFILLCSLSPLASSHRTAQTPQAAPHLPTSPKVAAHGHRISQLTPARKRAFRRAQIRAVQHGSTRYRGQQHDLHSLSALKFRRPRHLPARPQQAQPNQATTPVHMSFVSWNCGGLHAARFTELLAWLHDAPNQGRTVPKIVCIQETKWPHSSEFTSGQWRCVHSGMGDSTGGVLFMIHASLARPDQIRHNEVIAGRALHIRLEIAPPADLLGVYQVAWNPNHTSLQGSATDRTQALLARRLQVWQTVHHWISGVPQRNQLLLLGDFNCTLMPQSPHAM